MKKTLFLLAFCISAAILAQAEESDYGPPSGSIDYDGFRLCR